MILPLLKRTSVLLLMALLISSFCYAGKAQPLLEKGWASLVRDEDTTALLYFSKALIEAEHNNDTADKAQALLYLGICYYSVSYSKGLDYCNRALAEYKKMENAYPARALEGRSRCLQLVSTIKSRQGQYRESINLSMEALKGLVGSCDSMGDIGIIYNSLGTAYSSLALPDSSAYFHRLALAEHLRNNNLTYLPGAYIQVANLEKELQHSKTSFDYYTRAQQLSDSTGNRQAQVWALIGLGEWQVAFKKDYHTAETNYLQALSIANTLTDKTFSIKAIDHLLQLYKQTGNYQQAMAYQEKLVHTRDSIYSWDRQKEMREMEIRFDVAEKDRSLELLKKEKKITVLTNYLLWGGLATLMLLSGTVIYNQRHTNTKDKILLATQNELILAAAEQKRLVEEQKIFREQQMQQELEFKESQLSAMTLQMLQKNELLLELKERLDADKSFGKDQKLEKIINKGLSQDKEWSDFNVYFESINKNFYDRLKQAYPAISPNDLKICALIKLQLSIKEMAAILNISPDSVKTARYRLRKKLELNAEDNLTGFILGL